MGRAGLGSQGAREVWPDTLTRRDGLSRIWAVSGLRAGPLAAVVVAWGLLVPAAASAAGLSAYVPNWDLGGSGGVSQFTVGAGGPLQPMSTPTIAAGDGPWAVAVSPNGQYVYVANDDGGISQYSVGAGGALAPMATPTVAAGYNPYGVAVSPNGQYVYVANYGTDGSGGISQYTVGAGGALAPMSPPAVDAGESPRAVAVSPNGQYVYVVNYSTDGSGGSRSTRSGRGVRSSRCRRRQSRPAAARGGSR